VRIDAVKTYSDQNTTGLLNALVLFPPGSYFERSASSKVCDVEEQNNFLAAQVDQAGSPGLRGAVQVELRCGLSNLQTRHEYLHH
jgi:hypothetical protein